MSALPRREPGIENALPPLYARFTDAVSAADAAALASDSREFENLGHLIDAAEAAALGVSALHGWDAARARARAQDLIDRWRGLRTPAVRTLPPRLTGREQKVARLAAPDCTGLSTVAIADRLLLSARTVDNHRQHIYAKLGIISRHQLPHNV